jgi:hypothetical protein
VRRVGAKRLRRVSAKRLRIGGDRAGQPEQLVGRLVGDNTGLDGFLEYTVRVATSAANISNVARDPSSPPSIIIAIVEQRANGLCRVAAL